MSGAIRLGVVCDHLGLGGQEVALLELLRRLDRARFRPFLYSFRPGRLVPAIRTLRVPLVLGHDRPHEDARWTDRDRAAVTRFRRTLAYRLRDDAIDVCLVFAWPGAVAAAREAGVTAIVERVDGPSLARRLADKSSCRRVICESDAVRALLLSQRALLRVVPERVRVVRNGIDLRRFDPRRYDRRRCRRALGLRDGDFAVGTVARLAPEKNLGHLLDALRQLTDRSFRRPERLKAFVAGPDGGEGPALDAAARRLGLGHVVRFLGAREDVPRILAALDVFVLPSLYEGTSRALLEAMAMALPVVVSNLPALAEVIDGNGYLVGALDPHQTSLALDDLCRDPALRRKLGARSRQLARAHDVDEMVRRYEAVIAEAFDEARREGPEQRRIAFAADPSVAAEAATVRAIVRRLRIRGVDVGMVIPPARRRRRSRTTLSPGFGWSLRRSGADLVVARSPRLVPVLAESAQGNELVFWPRAAETRGAAAGRAVELADRVVFATDAARRSGARRWRPWAWKFSASSLSAAARDLDTRLAEIVRTPRPRAPRAAGARR